MADRAEVKYCADGDIAVLGMAGVPHGRRAPYERTKRRTTMIVQRQTQTRLDELKALLGQERLSDEVQLIGSLLVDAWERLDRLSEHNQDQDEILRPEEHRRI